MVRLREGRDENDRRRGLGRRLEARLLRLGIQGQAQRPECRLRAIAALCRRAGKPAAPGCQRHGSLPDPYKLDQHDQRRLRLALDELRDSRKLRLLKWAFTDPEQLKPNQTRQKLTEEVAAEFAALAQRLRDRNHPSQVVAHFINRLVFCMFAESKNIGLLPNKIFARMLEEAERTPSDFEELAAQLFDAMREGGRIGYERVEWFNGGLFDDDRALPLKRDGIRLVRRAAER